MNKRKLFICGDIHGALRTLVWEIDIRRKIENADIIIVGDIGVGFGRPRGLEASYKRVEEKLRYRDVKIWGIRGNHDDPSYFDGSIKFPFLELLPDHKVVKIGNYDVYPIGGGVSEDREERIKTNERYERYGSHKRIYWERERVEPIIDNLPPKVDIIVSHMAPISFRPVAERPDEATPEIWEEELWDRRYLDYIQSEVRSGYWFYGHYHKSYEGESGLTMYRGLSELELFEVTEKRELP